MAKYPKVFFRYSWIYDQIWKERWKSKNYPSTRKILNYIKKVEKLWRKDEKKVLLELSKITHLKWKSKYIDCYMVGRHRPFSQPLTMPVYEKSPDYFIDTLVHELIHNIFVQNLREIEKAWQYLKRKYRKESITSLHHIYLHAFHKHIFLKFYNEKRLKRDIQLMSSYKDYKRSWQIVEKEGYQNIIKEFQKRIK